MSKLKRNFRVLTLALVAVAAVGSAAVAQRQLAGRVEGRPEVKVALAGAVERGGRDLALSEVEAVRPGEILKWEITSTNEGTGEAREYKAVGHIPAGTAFVQGSAEGENGSTVTFSIDGGKTFSKQPIVEERQADGSVKIVPAPVSMYTEVRYEWSDGLAAGGKLNASYKVRVK
ncbi:MAG TPA: hypothetical protein VGV38_01700 [Pyrinomonadaceae bacterium]|nr:hypothetical protein [Pyrinomonadaceae bacterium]